MSEDIKKKLLVVGARGELGSYLVNQYKDSYQVFQCSRSQQADFVGDICSRSFLERMNNEFPDPDILINCAAIHSQDLFETIEVNVLYSSYLLHLYYNSMDKGHIISIGSNARYAGGRVHEYMSHADLFYSFSKKCTGEFIDTISYSEKNPKVQMSIIEPEYLSKGMGGVGTASDSKGIELIDHVSVKKAVDFILDSASEAHVQQVRIRNKRNHV